MFKATQSDCCFSLMTSQRSLDLEVETPDERHDWVEAFEYLVARSKILRPKRANAPSEVFSASSEASSKNTPAPSHQSSMSISALSRRLKNIRGWGKSLRSKKSMTLGRVSRSKSRRDARDVVGHD